MKAEPTIKVTTVKTTKHVANLQLWPADIIVMLRERYPLMMKAMPEGSKFTFDAGDSYSEGEVTADNPLRVTITFEETLVEDK